MKDIKDIYPWFDRVYNDFEQAYMHQQLHHASLFTAIAGLGRLSLCRSLARMLLCVAAKPAKPCGQCSGCILFAAGNHPDFIILGSDTTEQTITIDSVRSISSALEQKPHQGFNRVVIVHEAHRLNQAASNAMLKTLEEPPVDTYMLWTSSRPYRLSATVRSRLRTYPLAVPGSDEAISWLNESENLTHNQAEVLLAQANGAPLLAKEYQNPEYREMRKALQLVVDYFRLNTGSASLLLKSLEKYECRDIFMLLDGWLCEMIKYKLSGTAIGVANSELSEWLTNMCNDLVCRAAFQLRDKLWTTIEMIESQINPNVPLLYVDCFLSLKFLWVEKNG